MLRRHITRRHALKLGAAAALAGVARPPGSGFAAAAGCRVPCFEKDLSKYLGDGRASAAAAGWRTLPVLRAPQRFDMLGLRWSRGSHVHAEVRARRRNGPWTPWTPLHAAGDHAPDSAAKLLGTDPCWTDSADLFQVRIRGSVRGLRARFVRAKPTARLAQRSSRRLRARSAAARRPGAQSSQSTPPPIIARAGWGGDTCPPRSPAEYGQLQLAFVHHTVTANDYAPEDSASIVLGICRYHRDHNRWNDLGYNFLVDKYGQIFEGRAGGIDQAVIGAQAQGYNTDSTGIAVLGEHTAGGISPEAAESVSRLIAWKLSLHGVPVTGQVTLVSRGGSENRYPEGTMVTLERISGHRDGDKTSCPGDALYAQLPAIRERAAALAVPVSSLSMTASATIVRYPTPVTVSGALRFGDGSPPAGKPVQIQFQMAGAAWEVVQTVPTAADGTWSATLDPSSSGIVRAVYPGEQGRPPLEAPAVSIRVLPRLSISLSARRVRTRRKIRVRGTLDPATNTRIELLFERRVRRNRWVRAQRKRINVRNGGYDTYVRPRIPGQYRVTVKAPGATIRRLVRAL